jgi:hypothetical protein
MSKVVVAQDKLNACKKTKVLNPVIGGGNTIRPSANAKSGIIHTGVSDMSTKCRVALLVSLTL